MNSNDIPAPATATPAPEPTPAKTKRRRSLLNQQLAAELLLASEVAATSEKTEYTAALAAEGIDAAIVADLRARIAEANALAAAAEGRTAGKEVSTQNEDACRAVLLRFVSLVQSRAKRAYKPGDPRRARYFIAEKIRGSRLLLESSAQTMLLHLSEDTLPGMKPEDVTAFQAALAAYSASKTEQTGEQSGATTTRAQFRDKVKAIAGLRRHIQYAVDSLWPASVKNNAGIRIEFKMNAGKSLR